MRGTDTDLLICYAGYIKDFQVHDPHRVGKITVELQGRIKDCRALMYRQDIKAQDIEKYRFNKLPTHQVWVIFVAIEQFCGLKKRTLDMSYPWVFADIMSPLKVINFQQKFY